MSLLTIKNLSITINQRPILQEINFTINESQTLALLGESGSGKSLTAFSIMRLLPPAAIIVDESSIKLMNTDLLALSEVDMQKIRGRDVGMIFQEPMTALNPVLTIGDQVSEVLKLHLKLSRKEIYQRTLELLTEVELSPHCYRQYPHQLSGGMRQRVVIAMAIAAHPKLLIADEPTSALDIFTQTQILKLLKNLQEKFGMAILFITHDRKVAAHIAHRTIVLKDGQVMEQISQAKIWAY